MENKTTTELLDLLESLVTKEGNLKAGWEDALEELKSREPFNAILKNSVISDEETLEGRIENIEQSIKELKRHKHNPNNCDVLIRI